MAMSDLDKMKMILNILENPEAQKTIEKVSADFRLKLMSAVTGMYLALNDSTPIELTDEITMNEMLVGVTSIAVAGGITLEKLVISLARSYKLSEASNEKVRAAIAENDSLTDDDAVNKIIKDKIDELALKSGATPKSRLN